MMTIRLHAGRRSPATSRSGFTILEVMISLAILAFGILAMGVMQLQALKQGGAGRHTTDAAAVARTYLEQVHRLPWTSLTTAQAAGGWVTPAWAGAQGAVATAVDAPLGGTAIEHSYTVAWRVSAVAGTACMLDVEMRVTWNEEGVTAPKTVTLATRRYNWGGAAC